MNNEKRIEISTNNLLVLCEIFEDYEAFYEDLEDLIKQKKKKDLIIKIYDYIQKNKFSFPNKKYDAFIKKHQHTIEIMNKYSCLSDFTVLSYNAKGEKKENLPEDYFYEYIKEHQEDFETIKNVILRIKNLGINKTIFGEHLDFTKTMFELNTPNSHDFVFLENIEVAPTYPNYSIKYKSNSSPYLMYLQLNFFMGYVYEISEHQRKIELNSLVFNPSLLPNEITVESTINVIKALAQKQEESKDIKDVVDVSIATDRLKSEFESLKKRYDTIDKVKDNRELKELLIEMQNIMAKLQTFEESFTQQIIDTYPDLSEDIIKKEKTQEEDRRYNSID